MNDSYKKGLGNFIGKANQVHKKRHWLLPIAWLYGFVISVRNFLYDTGRMASKDYPMPVICVGNITVGGTGKTPISEYLIRLLKKNFKVAMLSRGYKRESKGYVLADMDTSYSMIGDEPYQIKQKFPSAIVAVCENRCVGIERLMEEFPEMDLTILDDAFQHRRVKAGLNILLMDYNQLIYEDCLLPVGRLREPMQAKDRAHILIVTKCDTQMKPIDYRLIMKHLELKAYQSLFFSAIRYGDMVPVFDHSEPGTLFYGYDYYDKLPAVLLVTGIAVNQPLIDHLNGFVSSLDVLTYPDHHSYTDEDLRTIMETFNAMPQKEKIIVTTEKDQVRLQELSTLTDRIKDVLYYIPIEIYFLQNQRDEFNKLIYKYVTGDKRVR